MNHLKIIGTDQFILKKSIDNFELDNKSKVIRLTDENLNFKRLTDQITDQI